MAERDPLLGTSIGHYAIDKLIGEGGMGRVYLAHHANLPNKRYAFKVLLGDHSASSAMRLRFTREAERASQLDHPNVVRVVDFGHTKHGLLYIVMDYVDGVSLVSLIGAGAMPPAQVIALVREICKGLIYAHDAGIVHRDLKPENILVSPGPDGPIPRIVDFGLALSVDQSDARLTESGMTMGTPLFAAPEQMLGRPLDHRADLYALGMTMFEMLTGGITPFDGDLMEVVAAKAVKDTPRISERAPDVPILAELDDLVAQLTRRRPADRFADAREVVEALDRISVVVTTGTRPEKQRRSVAASADALRSRGTARRGEMSGPGGKRSEPSESITPDEGARRAAIRKRARNDDRRHVASGHERHVPTETMVGTRWSSRRGWLGAGLVATCGLAAAMLFVIDGGSTEEATAPSRDTRPLAPGAVSTAPGAAPIAPGTAPMASGAAASGAGSLAPGAAASGAGSLAPGAAAPGTGPLASGAAASGAGSLGPGAAAPGAGPLASGAAPPGAGSLAPGAAASGAGPLASGTAASGAGPLAPGTAASGAGPLASGTGPLASGAVVVAPTMVPGAVPIATGAVSMAPGAVPIAFGAVPASSASNAAVTAAPITAGEAARDSEGGLPGELVPGRRRSHQRAARPLHDDVIPIVPAKPSVAAKPVAPAKPAAPKKPVARGPGSGSAALHKPPPASELRAKLDRIDVSGSLPTGAVQRAIERSWPAMASCVSAVPGIALAHFKVGEGRRALNVRATGAAPETTACIVAALSEVRTETAPDVGDVDVTVRIAFVVSK